MSTIRVGDVGPQGWSLVAGKFRGTDRTYFYLIRGQLMCDTPLKLEHPSSEDGYTYSNPFTIEHVLARFGAHINKHTMESLGHYLSSKRELRVLVGDELQNVTWGYPFHDIVFEEKASPKLKEAVDNWQATLKGVAAMNEAIKKKGENEVMSMNCGCKNEGSMSSKGALSEVLFYWHDEVHDRIGELIGEERAVVREASVKKAFVEQMAAQIVEFERQGNEDKWDAEARARRNDRLCSLLTDWVEVPKSEADQLIELDRVLKGARARLEAEFESLFVRAKVVKTGEAEHWLGAVGIYGKDGLDFDIEGDARRFIREVSAKR